MLCTFPGYEEGMCTMDRKESGDRGREVAGEGDEGINWNMKTGKASTFRPDATNLKQFHQFSTGVAACIPELVEKQRTTGSYPQFNDIEFIRPSAIKHPTAKRKMSIAGEDFTSSMCGAHKVCSIKTLLILTSITVLGLLPQLSLAAPLSENTPPPPRPRTKPARDVSTLEYCQGIIELYRFAELAKFPSGGNRALRSPSNDDTDTPNTPGPLPAEMLRTCKAILKAHGKSTTPVVMIPPSSPPPTQQEKPKYPPPPAKAARLTSTTVTKSGVTIVMPSRPPPRQRVQVGSNTASTQRRLRAGQEEDDEVDDSDADEVAASAATEAEDGQAEDEPIIPASQYTRATAAWPFRVYNSNHDESASGNEMVKAALKTTPQGEREEDEEAREAERSGEIGGRIQSHGPNPTKVPSRHDAGKSSWQWDVNHAGHSHSKIQDHKDEYPAPEWTTVAAALAAQLCPSWQFLVIGLILACAGVFISTTKVGKRATNTKYTGARSRKLLGLRNSVEIREKGK
ncbi:hypothetical protein DFH27DRAFT_655204 [Peziza echinospora]|nr:hypothetical protein DFH27DRAFT_655204 [Peziza echinospora]